ncbi:MAG: PhzF family phenazine biosynthesis protein [Alphaproteobacteria bacterium]
MNIPLFQIDAFTSRVFGGNPAAVCPLAAWLPDETMQAIAAENNLSETAFFVPRGEDYDLRWFTPATEVDLCGHATLATGALVLGRLAPDRRSVRFHTRSGVLAVAREGERFVMDFPARPATSVPADARVTAALGRAPSPLLSAERDYLAVFADEGEVRALAPDQAALMALDRPGMIVTAPGREVDFVSRFFAPRMGVPEDPVTGSAHCTLTPYWVERLKKHMLSARQISARGGELDCELKGERVVMKGRAAFYLEGTIHL